MSLQPIGRSESTQPSSSSGRRVEIKPQKQGVKTGARDAGNRTAVTGGKQLDGFVELVRDFLIECEIEQSCIFCNQAVELPGWFRQRRSGICWLSSRDN